MKLKSAEVRQVYAGAIGNILEWYDFAAYAFLAPIIGEVFFPSSSAVNSLLAAYGAFAVGYLSRPIGSIVFGHLGDSLGRKPALILSMVIMGGATLLIAILPGYAEIGVAAPALLLLLRALQGISVAGEFGTSAVLLVERASPDRRCLVGGLISGAVSIGFLLGSGVGAAISTILGDAAMSAWGWRIPFALGALIAVHVIVMRRGLEEVPLDKAEKSSLPVIDAVRHHHRSILLIMLLVLPLAVTFYTCFVYASSYLTKQMHFSTAQALDISTLALAVQVLISPVAGYLADRYGPRKLMLFVVFTSLLVSWPLWWQMHQPSVMRILFAQVGFALINGMGWALIVPMMIDLVPKHVRCSASGIAYNLCVGLFGGTAPWVATYLVARTADDFAPAWYMIGTALLSLIALFQMPKILDRRA